MKKTTQCKGIYLKVKVNSYIFGNEKNDGTIHQNKVLKLIKRKSCSGCSDCQVIWDYLRQNLDHDETMLNSLENNIIYNVIKTDTGIQFNKIK